MKDSVGSRIEEYLSLVQRLFEEIDKVSNWRKTLALVILGEGFCKALVKLGEFGKEFKL